MGWIKKTEIVLSLVPSGYGGSLSPPQWASLLTSTDPSALWILFLCGSCLGWWWWCCYCNKALGRFLVFKEAQRKPGPSRSSGGWEVRCGRPWDSRVSGLVRFPRRCLWWTDEPCSSWLLWMSAKEKHKEGKCSVNETPKTWTIADWGYGSELRLRYQISSLLYIYSVFASLSQDNLFIPLTKYDFKDIHIYFKENKVISLWSDTFLAFLLPHYALISRISD